MPSVASEPTERFDRVAEDDDLRCLFQGLPLEFMRVALFVCWPVCWYSLNRRVVSIPFVDWIGGQTSTGTMNAIEIVRSAQLLRGWTEPRLIWDRDRVGVRGVALIKKQSRRL